MNYYRKKDNYSKVLMPDCKNHLGMTTKRLINLPAIIIQQAFFELQ